MVENTILLNNKQDKVENKEKTWWQKVGTCEEPDELSLRMPQKLMPNEKETFAHQHKP